MNKIFFFNIFFKMIFLFTFIRKIEETLQYISIILKICSYVKYRAIYILIAESYSKIT